MIYICRLPKSATDNRHARDWHDPSVGSAKLPTTFVSFSRRLDAASFGFRAAGRSDMPHPLDRIGIARSP